MIIPHIKTSYSRLENAAASLGISLALLWNAITEFPYDLVIKSAHWLAWDLAAVELLGGGNLAFSGCLFRMRWLSAQIRTEGSTVCSALISCSSVFRGKVLGKFIKAVELPIF